MKRFKREEVKIEDVFIDNTQVDKYALTNGKYLYVKREDLSCPLPGPMFSKIRGVYPHLVSRPHAKKVGVLDTFHSKGGWAVALCCYLLGKQCFVYYPHYKGDTELRESQANAKRFGAKLVALPAGRSAVLFHSAKADLKRRGKPTFMQEDDTVYMMPNGLKLPETVEGTAEEVARTQEATTCDSVVISISTATIAAGVLRGLLRIPRPLPHIYFHFGYSRSHAATFKYVMEQSGYAGPSNKFHWIDEGYAYKDAVENVGCPFPCNPYYDLKAYKWVREHANDIVGNRILFWNIGA